MRAVYSEVNWGRIETWHPAPAPFFDVGVLVDVGVYPLTLVTTMIGRARSVRAWGWELKPDRLTIDGTPFRIGSPDLIVAAVELEGGAVMRLTASFYVGPSKQRGLEFHGDRATGCGGGRASGGEEFRSVGHQRSACRNRQGRERRHSARPGRIPAAAGARRVAGDGASPI